LTRFDRFAFLSLGQRAGFAGSRGAGGQPLLGRDRHVGRGGERVLGFRKS